MRKLQYIFGNVGIMFKVIILNSIATLFISLTLAFISIQYAQTQIKEQHEETFSRQLNDIFGLIHYIEERVKNKEITLEEAQESVKRYVVGIKDAKGSRNIHTSKFIEENSQTMAWANDTNGNIQMNVSGEGGNMWNMKIYGRYVARENWLNLNKCGKLITEYYQHEQNEPKLWWGYTRYYEPWGWILGVGGLKKDLYDKPVDALKFKFAGITILLILLANLIPYLFMRTVLNPIKASVNLAKNIADGDLSERLHHKFHDETGDLVEALNKMSDNLEYKVEFSDQIKQGNLAVDFNISSDKDKLGIALLAMQKSLLENKEATEKRNQKSKKLDQFNMILRKYSDNVEQLADRLITHIIEDTNALQGALFFVKEDDNQNKYLELTSCFAYHRKKHKYKRVLPNEGLVGQTYVEKKYIYVDNVPKDYPSITSGLGEMKPEYILLIPLISQDEVLGVLELGSIYKYTPQDIELLEVLGTYIASTYSSIWNTEKIKRLLQTSQEQEQELRTREEEMRQNMEELLSTQEQNQRKENQINQKIIQTNEKVSFYKSVLDAIPLALTLTDDQMNPIFLNKLMAEQSGKTIETLSKNHQIIQEIFTYSNSSDVLNSGISEIKHENGKTLGYLKIESIRNKKT